MALMISTTTELAHQYQTTFSKKMLPRARQKLVLDEYATKMPFPKNAGAKTIRFFRQESGSAANVSALSEGVALTTYSEIGLDYVEATLAQYGQVYKISDVLSMTELFDTLAGSIDRAGEDAGLHADQIIRNAVVTGTTAAGNKRYAGGAADYAALKALTSTNGKMKIADLLDAMTQLTIQRAPTKNGEYFAIVPPQVARDLMTDATYWIPFSTYQNNTQIMKGEVGKWYNVRIVVATVPFREDGTTGGGSAEGTYSSAGTDPILTTIVTGSDGFGVPIMAGGSPFSPKVIVNDKADKTDPLNQYTMMGWKAYWTVVMLNALWVVTIRSKTAFA